MARAITFLAAAIVFAAVVVAGIGYSGLTVVYREAPPPPGEVFDVWKEVEKSVSEWNALSPEEQEARHAEFVKMNGLEHLVKPRVGGKGDRLSP